MTIDFNKSGRGGERLLDWFDEEYQFEILLSEAEEAAVTEREMDFVAGLQEKYAEWKGKMYLSGAQLSWLRKIAAGE